MSGEKQETVHVVMRAGVADTGNRCAQPVKVFDDRSDARAYAKRMNLGSRKYLYRVVPVKKG